MHRLRSIHTLIDKIHSLFKRYHNVSYIISLIRFLILWTSHIFLNELISYNNTGYFNIITHIIIKLMQNLSNLHISSSPIHWRLLSPWILSPYILYFAIQKIFKRSNSKETTTTICVYFFDIWELLTIRRVFPHFWYLYKFAPLFFEFVFLIIKSILPWGCQFLQYLQQPLLVTLKINCVLPDFYLFHPTSCCQVNILAFSLSSSSSFLF